MTGPIGGPLALAGGSASRVLWPSSWAADRTAPGSWALWDCMLSPEMRRSICQILVRRLISIGGQPMPRAATRCYLIQMLGSALTCTNGCSCWSPDEENSPWIFLTMDVLCQLMRRLLVWHWPLNT